MRRNVANPRGMSGHRGLFARPLFALSSRAPKISDKFGNGKLDR